MNWWVRVLWAAATATLLVAVAWAVVAAFLPPPLAGVEEFTLQIGETEFELTLEEPGREVELVIPIVNTGRVTRRVIGVAEG